MVLLHVVNIYVYANVYTHESSTNAYARKTVTPDVYYEACVDFNI